MKKLKPLYDRVFVRPDASPEKTESGLFIPTQAKEKPVYGTITDIGPGKMRDDGTLIPLPVKVGEKALFGKHAGTKLIVNGEEMLMFYADDLLATVEEVEDEKAAA